MVATTSVVAVPIGVSPFASKAEIANLYVSAVNLPEPFGVFETVGASGNASCPLRVASTVV